MRSAHRFDVYSRGLRTIKCQDGSLESEGDGLGFSGCASAIAHSANKEASSSAVAFAYNLFRYSSRARCRANMPPWYYAGFLELGTFSHGTKYHPSRVLTLVYQPFSFGMISILTYHEAKLNTRKRNLFGYTLFFISSLTVLILDLASSGKGGIGHYIGVCVISVCFGVASALVEGGMVGDLSSMSPKMMQSYVLGMVASATLTSALRLITKVAFSGSREGLHKGACM
ncbi:hypothetical protein NE237_002421 [Protea cynaroides]|uniref:Uncharacterized protein n=1 Tax=Protea cynaroides TaxID=273540 RepID=A0A9Q0KV65_9MAGN|nr:hypothetical protein NE237_002421 [Protea cynaroides]